MSGYKNRSRNSNRKNGNRQRMGMLDEEDEEKQGYVFLSFENHYIDIPEEELQDVLDDLPLGYNYNIGRLPLDGQRQVSVEHFIRYVREFVRNRELPMILRVFEENPDKIFFLQEVLGNFNILNYLLLALPREHEYVINKVVSRYNRVNEDREGPLYPVNYRQMVRMYNGRHPLRVLHAVANARELTLEEFMNTYGNVEEVPYEVNKRFQK